MQTTKCNNCGFEIGMKTPKCVNCGEPIGMKVPETGGLWRKLIFILIAISIVRTLLKFFGQ
ncbi:MAG TPA: hypothetical protein PKC29_08210 [Thermodesulfobacteriota bacterium]|nr:hypothetical protein [Thermodesulfobacteriota bacterium]